MCVESMALQTAAKPKLPGNLQTYVDELDVVGVEQPGLQNSAVVSSRARVVDHSLISYTPLHC